MNPLGLVVLAAAVFTLIVAVGNWDRFMLRALTNHIGRNGSRLFYVLIALGLLWLGIMMLEGR
jgi:hypothetical protein